MQVLRNLAQIPVVLGVMFVGGLLLLGLPVIAYVLIDFVLDGSLILFFIPGIALYVFGFCVPVGLRQWSLWQAGQPSRPFRLPKPIWLGLGAAVAIVLGQFLLLASDVRLFWLFFLLAAALPPLVALALASHRLGAITTWRRVLAGVLSGSLLSTHLTLLLGGVVSLLAYALILPLRDLMAQMIASKSLEQLFYSRSFVLTLAEVALVAPLVEELTKPLAAILLSKRLRGAGEAFLVGMAGGAGFAILENMLYEAASPGLWAGIALLRGIGGVLHPLNAGLVAVGWYGVRHHQPRAWRRLLGLYGLAVGIHALWNGALAVLLSGIGVYFFGADTWRFNIYGLGQPAIIIVFMLLEAAALWRLLAVVTDHLRGSSQADLEPMLDLRLQEPRRLAIWATALLGVLVPLGALYGPLLASYANKFLP